MSREEEDNDPWAGGPLGFLLRSWRRRRSMSQRALADRVGLSSRHVSFLETGRARPTKASLEWLAKALGLDDAETAQLYEVAGFSGPAVLATATTDALGPHRSEIQLLLKLLPCAALVHDRLGTVLAVNAAFRSLVGPYVDSETLGGASSGHTLIEQLSQHVENIDDLVQFYRRRVAGARLVGETADPALVELDQRLGAPPAQLAPLSHCGLEVRLRAAADGVRKYWLLTATLGAPQDVALRNLRLVQILPFPDSGEP